MQMKEYMDVLPEVLQALKKNQPVVALESTILSHGMPYPENVAFAAEVEKVVRAEGAVPATIALIGGRIKIGLTPDELTIMCKAEDVGKVSRRDMATYSVISSAVVVLVVIVLGIPLARMLFG